LRGLCHFGGCGAHLGGGVGVGIGPSWNSLLLPERPVLHLRSPSFHNHDHGERVEFAIAQ
jgi:hypothetical protein